MTITDIAFHPIGRSARRIHFVDKFSNGTFVNGKRRWQAFCLFGGTIRNGIAALSSMLMKHKRAMTKKNATRCRLVRMWARGMTLLQDITSRSCTREFVAVVGISGACG